MRLVSFFYPLVRRLRIIMNSFLNLSIRMFGRLTRSIDSMSSIRHPTIGRLHWFSINRVQRWRSLSLHILLIIIHPPCSVILVDDLRLIESLNLFAQSIIIFYSGILLDCVCIWIKVPLFIPPLFHTLVVIRSHSFLLPRKSMLDPSHFLSGFIRSLPIKRHKALHIMKS